ncbi:hypothetical protein H8D73_00660 [bacterium]|nr:hypothetical protein [bacterium]
MQLWTRLVTISNNNWIVGVVLALVFGQVIPEETVSRIQDMVRVSITFTRSYGTPILMVSAGLLVVLAAIRIRAAWPLLHWPGMNRIWSIDPGLTWLNWIKRNRFDRGVLEAICDRFRTLSDAPYYLLREGVRDADGNEQPLDFDGLTLTYKLRARDHLALSDFQDLRLLREVIAAGGRVLVVVFDTPIPEGDVRREDSRGCCSDDTIRSTVSFTRRVLGSRARVVVLSKVLKSREADILRYIFDSYIPVYASKLAGERIQIEADPEDYAIAYGIGTLVFGLFLAALGSVRSGRPPYLVVQWVKRESKWAEYSKLVQPGLVSGLLLAQTFYDARGNTVPAFTPNCGDYAFTVTEEPFSVGRKLMAAIRQDGVLAWAIADDYVRHIADNAFGLAKERVGRDFENLGERERGRFRDFVLSFAAIDGNQLRPETLHETMMERESAYLRFRLYERFKRVRRALTRPTA